MPVDTPKHRLSPNDRDQAGRAAGAIDLTEKELTGQVLDLLDQTGWVVRYHTYRSKKSPGGFPDWVFVRERVVFAELKTRTGKVSVAQKHWLRSLLAAGAEAYVIRPDVLEELAVVLAARRRGGRGPASAREFNARDVLLQRARREAGV